MLMLQGVDKSSKSTLSNEETHTDLLADRHRSRTMPSTLGLPWVRSKRPIEERGERKRLQTARVRKATNELLFAFRC
jgi:hypothetical protein